MRSERPAFHKIVGTGNDFVFVDLREHSLREATALSRAVLARRIADRHQGVGADGVVFVEKLSGHEALKWDFYNSDGSAASMCGNALRCMGRWGREVLGQDDIQFVTARGPVEVRYRDGGYWAELTFLKLEPRGIDFVANGRTERAILIDTGVPHAVREVSSLADRAALAEDIRALRFHQATGAAGANVTFFARLGDGELQTITFERGVEDFTLSCGTGVLAAAAVGLGVTHHHPPRDLLEVGVETPGGRLRVRFEPGLRAITLVGPSLLICEGRIHEEILR